MIRDGYRYGIVLAMLALGFLASRDTPTKSWHVAHRDSSRCECAYTEHCTCGDDCECAPVRTAKVGP